MRSSLLILLLAFLFALPSEVRAQSSDNEEFPEEGDNVALLIATASLLHVSTSVIVTTVNAHTLYKHERRGPIAPVLGIALGGLVVGLTLETAADLKSLASPAPQLLLYGLAVGGMGVGALLTPQRVVSTAKLSPILTVVDRRPTGGLALSGTF